ncbi:MAG: kelch repeat-containing protein [Planctomycetota bacterium]
MKRVLCSILVVLALTGCKDDDTNLPFTVPFTPTPPVIQGETAIFYNVTARDPNVNAGAQVFEDGQTPRTLTVTQGSPALSSAMGAPEGFENFFVWDPIQDLGPGLHRDVVVRVFGLQRDLGLPGDTAPLIVDLTDRLDPLTGAPSLEGAVIAPLPDGSVWTAGGLQGGSLSLAGYRYDPRTNTFTASDGLRIARRDASSARLSDGGVLVVGGRDAQGTALAAAEVFRLDAAGNGATRGVPAGLLQARTRPAIAPLQNGQALVVGGATSGGPSPQAERFVPDANGGRFVAAVSDPLLARTAATATRLPDGRVWVAGGFDAGGQPLGSTALVAADGQSVSPGPTLGNPRGEHAAVALPDGRVALLGGTTQAGSDAGASSVVDLFDPDTNQLQNLPNLQRGRRGVGAAYTRGSLIALGGSGQQDTPQTAERLALEDTAWSLIRVPGLARPAARAVRSGAGHVIVVGGAQVPERYWPLGFAATEGFDLVRAPSRPRARHTTTLLNQGFALVAGGTAGIDSGIAGCELFDPRTDTWNDTGSLATARQDHAAASIATGVLVVGGRNAQGVVASAELYNAFSGAWEPAGTLLTPRADATATGVGGRRVLVAGGVDAAGNALSSLELWDPVSRSFTAAGSPRRAARRAATRSPRASTWCSAGAPTPRARSPAPTWSRPSTCSWAPPAAGPRVARARPLRRPRLGWS